MNRLKLTEYMQSWRSHFPLNSCQAVSDLVQQLLHWTNDARDNNNADPSLILISIILGYFEKQFSIKNKSNRDGTTTEEVSNNIGCFGDTLLTFSQCENLMQQFVDSLEQTNTTTQQQAFSSLHTTSKSKASHQKKHSVSSHGSNTDQSEPASVTINKLYSVSAVMDDWLSQDSLSSENNTMVAPLVRQISHLLLRQIGPRSNRDSFYHSQSIYAFLQDKCLDTFGLTFAVVAILYALGCPKVKSKTQLLLSRPLSDYCCLALSEDHAWIEVQTTLSDTPETCPVLHKRIEVFDYSRSCGEEEASYNDTDTGNNWLYLANHPVRCHTRQLCIAAAVTAIDSQLQGLSESDSASTVLTRQLQFHLLQMLYREGILSAYPLALSTLADLCELHSTTMSFLDPHFLHFSAIQTNREVYDNRFIEPYLRMSAFCQRQERWKETFEYWANAATAISRYNYTADDDAIYKEFLHIARDLMPQVMRKFQSASLQNAEYLEAFSAFLRFYDGLCKWEENSCRPVLHIVWAMKFNNVAQMFPPWVRAALYWEEEKDNAESITIYQSPGLLPSIHESQPIMDDKMVSDGSPSGILPGSVCSTVSPLGNILDEDVRSPAAMSQAAKPTSLIVHPDIVNLDDWIRAEDLLKMSTENLIELANLSEEKIFNPMYFLGASDNPFMTTNNEKDENATMNARIAANLLDDYLNKFKLTAFAPSHPVVESCSSLLPLEMPPMPVIVKATSNESRDRNFHQPSSSVLGPDLTSVKMRALRQLIGNKKWNSLSLELLLTAQSQVHLKRTELATTSAYSLPRKRSRR